MKDKSLGIASDAYLTEQAKHIPKTFNCERAADRLNQFTVQANELLHIVSELAQTNSHELPYRGEALIERARALMMRMGK